MDKGEYTINGGIITGEPDTALITTCNNCKNDVSFAVFGQPRDFLSRFIMRKVLQDQHYSCSKCNTGFPSIAKLNTNLVDLIVCADGRWGYFSPHPSIFDHEDYSVFKVRIGLWNMPNGMLNNDGDDSWSYAAIIENIKDGVQLIPVYPETDRLSVLEELLQQARHVADTIFAVEYDRKMNLLATILDTLHDDVQCDLEDGRE